MMKRLIYLICFVAALCSCTVKQDRSVCPSYLDVTVLRQAEGVCDSGSLYCTLWDADGVSEEAESLSGMSYRDTTLEYIISPRRIVYPCVTNCKDSKQCIVSKGEQFVPLYCLTEEVPCFNEVNTCLVGKLHKNFIRMTVRLSDRLKNQEGSCNLKVASQVDGVVFPFLSLHEGEFEYVAEVYDSIEVLLPRQKEEGLSLVYTGGEGNYTTVFNLSKFLKEKMKYDMSASDLSDFEIVIDLNEADFTITIVEWKDLSVGDFEF